MNEISDDSMKINQAKGDDQSMTGPLQADITDDGALDRALWLLLVQLSRKLQISSASIKAGVSSLLDYSIFWDGSTQHEFLDSINASTDQISRLIVLLSLVSRAQAGSIEMKAEPQVLQEIVSIVREKFQVDSGGWTMEITLPQSGKPVLVDYEYLMLALRFTLEVLSEITSDSKNLSVFAFEAEQDWKLDIVSTQSITEHFTLLVNEKIVELLSSNNLSPENRLKLYTIYRIFLHMHILTELVEYSDHKVGLRLVVPCVASD